MKFVAKFNRFTIFAIAAFTLLINLQVIHGCSINIPSDLPRFEPVILLSKGTAYEPFKPIGQNNTFAIGTRILLVCSGSLINSLNQLSLELTCSATHTWQSANGTTFQLSQLGCKAIPTSSLELTSQQCADGRGYVFKAGFVYNTNKFAPIFDICYDNITENTIYSHNVLNGKAIGYNVQESTRRAFRAEGMKFTTTATNNYYTINNQITRFQTYFGSSQPYVNNSNYLARGHLAPDADFVFSYEQLATYFYANAAPEFQIINAGNWIRVENLARALAMRYNDDLQVYTGYMGILEIANTAIFLDENEQIEAPEYFFKILLHDATNAAIVFVTSNNPFASAVDEFCTNVCDRAEVNNAIFKDYNRGYTFCCELDDFLQYYDGLPETVIALKLLNETVSSSSTTTMNPLLPGCSIRMPSDIPNPEPVYIVNNEEMSLFWPQGEYTSLPIGSELIVFCAGADNSLVGMNQAYLTLTCQEDETFYSAEKMQSYSLSQLACSKIPNSELLLTSERCANDAGYVFLAGFPTWNNEFLSTFTICYDNSTEHTLYACSIINGATQKFKINESTRRAFRANGMRFTTTATNNFYTINNQISKFQNFFGANQNYVSNTNYMARGHLTPDADFIFGYEQLSTYFYTNTAPEFQVINAGNWIRVENLARNLADGFGSNLLTFTGTLGILELPNGNSNIPIYLDDDQLIEAPLWYYKILVHPQLADDLVMITSNNPFASSVNEFCTNVCAQFGVSNANFGDISRGYTFCCTLSSFQNAVPNLPSFDLPQGWQFR